MRQALIGMKIIHLRDGGDSVPDIGLERVEISMPVGHGGEEECKENPKPRGWKQPKDALDVKRHGEGPKPGNASLAWNRFQKRAGDHEARNAKEQIDAGPEAE